MTVEKINFNCTCNECNRSNYDTGFKAKEVESLYEVKIGSCVNRICADCLTQLVGAAIVALNEK